MLPAADQCEDEIDLLQHCSKPPRVTYKCQDLELNLKSANKVAMLNTIRFYMNNGEVVLDLMFHIVEGETSHDKTAAKYTTVPHRLYNGLKVIVLTTRFS